MRRPHGNVLERRIHTRFHRRRCSLWSLSPRGSRMSPKTLYAIAGRDEFGGIGREGGRRGEEGEPVALQNEQNGAEGK